MFYEEDFDEDLRFGDIVKDIFVYPFSYDKFNTPSNVKINIKKEKYCIILTPCCSIAKTKILVAPLTPVLYKLTHNEYFREDMTNVNRKMNPEQSVSKSTWGIMPAAEKEKLIAEGYGYSFLNLFIYDKNDIFDEITFNDKILGEYKTRCRMIDFGDIYQVACKEIESASKYPKDLKILELTAEYRKELRDKLAHYYGRPAPEDAAEL